MLFLHSAPSIKRGEDQPPPYRAPSTTDPKLSALVNRDLNANERVSGDISAQIPRVVNPNDLDALVSVLMDTKDNDSVRNEVANLLRRSHYPGLPDALIKVLDNPAEGSRFRAFATQHLGDLAKDAPPDSELRDTSVTKFQSALDDRHFTVRAQALQNLCRLKDSKGRETAVNWLTNYKPCAPEKDGKPADPELERGSILNIAIRCCKDLDLKDQIPTIRQYVRDPNEAVRIAAIVALSDWRGEASRPAFEDAAKSANVRLQRCGAAVLKKLDTK